MAAIHKLPNEIIGQIAAGEVVERPASAVKELVENSIDAGAKNITVELREGGIEYLRVSDNGRGIPAEQIRLAFERHATSKISKAEDLYDIHTLGFRGEALASIAAVARVTCTTRTGEADFGTRAVVEAGEFIDIRQAASPVGTAIVVEKLFANAPVRLKFLKKPSVETTAVSDYMLRLILSHPDISFRFVANGKTMYHSSGDGSLESALFCIYGRDALKQMKKVQGHMNGVVLNGYVGIGELSRGNRQQQSFFVNGRYFRSGLLSRAVENGCQGRVMIGRFPMCALYLDMPYQQVDVNVHPNKLEVRFQNEPGVSAAVEALVRDAVQADSLSAALTRPTQNQPSAPSLESRFDVVKLDRQDEETAAAENQQKQPDLQAEAPVTDSSLSAAAETDSSLEQAVRQLKPVVIPAREANLTARESTSPASVSAVMLQRPQPIRTGFVPQKPQVPEKTRPIEPVRQLPVAKQPVQVPEPVQQEQIALPQQEKTPLRLVGVVFDTYWIFETGDRLLLVDQHAAHERILYDRFIKLYETQRVSQKLLSPQLVRLTAYDIAQVQEYAPLLADAGFEVEPFDETCVAIRAVPTLFGENDSPRELLMEALSECQAGRGQATREMIQRRVAQMACKHAIKGGDKLNRQQMEGFLKEMLQSDSMPNCPHGRPIVTEVTRYALEKRFKRIQ